MKYLLTNFNLYKSLSRADSQMSQGFVSGNQVDKFFNSLRDTKRFPVTPKKFSVPVRPPKFWKPVEAASRSQRFFITGDSGNDGNRVNTALSPIDN